MTFTLTYKDKPIWFETMGKMRFYLESPPTKKEYQPNLKSRLDKDTWILFADFDRLPKDFVDHEALRQYLNTLPVHVFKSFSGKSKAAILVKSKSMSKNKAYDTLRSVLGELVDSIDRQGMMTSFLRVQYFKAFQQWLNTAIPVEAIQDSSDWRVKNLTRPLGITDNEWKVLNFAASYEKEGPVSIPQEFVAEVMGLSMSSVHRAIKSLIEKEMLRLDDASYSPGKEARKYSVMLLSLRLWVATRRCLQGIVFTSPPSSIEDGTWYTTIWSCTNFFTTENAFLAWINTLQGLHAHGKRRFKRAMEAWYAHSRRNLMEFV